MVFGFISLWPEKEQTGRHEKGMGMGTSYKKAAGRTKRQADRQGQELGQTGQTRQTGKGSSSQVGIPLRVTTTPPPPPLEG